jgi:hypothetical protein
MQAHATTMSREDEKTRKRECALASRPVDQLASWPVGQLAVAKQSQLAVVEQSKKNPAALSHRGVLQNDVSSAVLPATATTSATAAARAATTAAAASALTLLRFIDAQRPAPHVLPVQGLDGSLCVRARHFDEAEAAWAARLTIVDQRNRLHGAMLFEQRAHVVLGRRKREIANIDFRHNEQFSL